LRGGSKGPNYSAEYVRDCSEKLTKADIPCKIMVNLHSYPHDLAETIQIQIDCSHGNSQKQHRKQLEVVEDIVCISHFFSAVILLFIQAQQMERGDTSGSIMGVMIESNLVEGRQDLPPSGPVGLKYGQSVTDACLSWDMTVPALDRLREAVRGRRELVSRKARGLEQSNGVKELKLNGVNGVHGVNGVNGVNGANGVNGH